MAPDCHVETYLDRRDDERRHRAAAVHTATGKRLYVTWPYKSEPSARTRAWRWIHEEYARVDAVGSLFARQREIR